MMTDSEKIFFDTAPFIYLLEGHPEYYDTIAAYIADFVQNGSKLITSVITYTEFCVKPEELQNQSLIEAFANLLSDLSFHLLDVTLPSAKCAYKLRAKYKFLKGMDSLQLAVAIESGCTQFLTNDKKLAVITEIRIVLVNSLLDSSQNANLNSSCEKAVLSNKGVN